MNTPGAPEYHMSSDTVQKVVQRILILFLSVKGTKTDGARKGTLRSTGGVALLFGVTFLNQLSDVRIGSHGVGELLSYCKGIQWVLDA